MLAKRITIRVSPELHVKLHRLADRRAVSLNALTVEALEAYAAEAQAERGEHLPLRELSTLLAPAAEAADLTEEELLRHARDVRRRIWEERYRKVIHAQDARQDPP